MMQLLVVTCVTAADMNGQGACGAEEGGVTVNHQNGKEVNILLVATEAWPLGPDASSSVWESKLMNCVRNLRSKVMQIIKRVHIRT